MENYILDFLWLDYGDLRGMRLHDWDRDGVLFPAFIANYQSPKLRVTHKQG